MLSSGSSILKTAPRASVFTGLSFSFPVFCVYYVTRGILQENRQELIVFVLSILLVMFRSIVNFTVLSAEQKPKLLVSLLVLINFAFLHVLDLTVLERQDNCDEGTDNREKSGGIIPTTESRNVHLHNR